MKVAELIEVLQGFNQDADIRLAMQPDWPLQFELDGATAVENLAYHLTENGRYNEDLEACEEHDDVYCFDCTKRNLLEEYGDTVWLTAGDHPRDPYAPRGAWAATVRW